MLPPLKPSYRSKISPVKVWGLEGGLALETTENVRTTRSRFENDPHLNTINSSTGKRKKYTPPPWRPPFFLFPSLRLYGVYPSFWTYGIYPFPLFSQGDGMHHSFFFLLCDLGVGRQTETRGVPRWWCILFIPLQYFEEPWQPRKPQKPLDDLFERTPWSKQPPFSAPINVKIYPLILVSHSKNRSWSPYPCNKWIMGWISIPVIKVVWLVTYGSNSSHGSPSHLHFCMRRQLSPPNHKSQVIWNRGAQTARLPKSLWDELQIADQNCAMCDLNFCISAQIAARIAMSISCTTSHDIELFWMLHRWFATRNSNHNQQSQSNRAFWST